MKQFHYLNEEQMGVYTVWGYAKQSFSVFSTGMCIHFSWIHV